MQKNFSYELFEKALLHKSLSAYDFCKLAKIHSGTVSNWKNVKEVKKLSHRAAISRLLGVEYENLCITENGKTGEANHHSDIVKITSWPVVSAVSAGPWIDNIDRLGDGESLGSVTAPSGLEDENGYGLIVTGDSMAPNYLPGDLLAVSPNREIRNGDLGIVFINNHHSPYGFEVVFKRVFFTSDRHVILRSLNQDYPPMDKVFGDGDGEVCKIHPVVFTGRKTYI